MGLKFCLHGGEMELRDYVGLAHLAEWGEADAFFELRGVDAFQVV